MGKGKIRLSPLFSSRSGNGGAVVCLLQVHPDWTVEQLRKALFFSGDFYRKHGKPDPLFIHGYGIPDVFLASGLKE